MFSVDRDPRTSYSKPIVTEIIEIEDDSVQVDFIKNGCVKLIFENKTLSDNFSKLKTEHGELKRKYENVHRDASNFYSENHQLKREITILSANKDLYDDKITQLMDDVRSTKEEVQKAKRDRDFVVEEWSKDVKKIKTEHNTQTLKEAEERQKLEKQIAELTQQNSLLRNEKNTINREFEKCKVSLKQQQHSNYKIKQKTSNLYSSLKAINQTSQEALSVFEKNKKAIK